jgi:flagellar assembly protein FliH
MSEAWATETIERRPVWARPSPRHFSPRENGLPAGFTAWADEPAVPTAAAAMLDPEALMADGFAQGLAEGRAAAELELADERIALGRLAHALETFRPEPPAALARLLAETVKRLVGDIVGQVEIDAALLAERAGAVAALLAEDGAPGRIRLNPADLARLEEHAVPVELVPDPAVAPGTVLGEGASGWIEDGPKMRLDRLRIALDRMAVAR